MFRTLIYPSSGACDCVVTLPDPSSCSQFVVCWSFGAASACKTNTTQNEPHQSSNTQRTENKTTDLVMQQHSRKLLMMDILMSETCWEYKKWNKIASDIKLVFYSSNFTPICFYSTTSSVWLKNHAFISDMLISRLTEFRNDKEDTGKVGTHEHILPPTFTPRELFSGTLQGSIYYLIRILLRLHLRKQSGLITCS